MTDEQKPPTPNPGSTAAVEAGCTCPVLDNNHGIRPPWPPHGWWVNHSCPMHGKPVDQ